ncbi:MAG: hypothetical protein V9H69_20635 [Anaerolineae bacterium]
MQAGVEKLQTTLEITLPATGLSDRFVSPELIVLISGPRFIFSPAEIYAVFPPRDSFGEWDNVLPHVELTPSTLPWQRKSGANDKTTPWLALILLQEDEWNDPGAAWSPRRSPGKRCGIKSGWRLKLLIGRLRKEIASLPFRRCASSEPSCNSSCRWPRICVG